MTSQQQFRFEIGWLSIQKCSFEYGLSTNMNSADLRKNQGSKGAKGEASIFEDAGRLKINLPRQYFGGKQVKKALGLQATPDNWAKAERIARRITLDLQDGQFDETLIKYGVKSNIKLLSSSDSLPPVPKLGTLEIWEKYLEYKKPTLKETTFVQIFKNTYSKAIDEAISTVGDDAIAIRNWLLSNRSLRIVKSILNHLSFAYQLCIKHTLIINNPFLGISDDLPLTKKNSRVNTYDDDSEQDIYSQEEVKKKAFTTDEVTAILDYVKSSKGKSYYPILHFLFLTGCRTGEAIALMWGDIKWNKQYIVIQRSYCSRIKKFVTTKTDHIRLFPMPKDGQLWNLLKSLESGKLGEIVFKSKTGKIFNYQTFGRFWRGDPMTKSERYPGVIPTLIKQGLVSKYLPLYNTRHTFISYQINECGVPPHVIKDWCGHSEKMTSGIYRQEDLLTKPVDYDKPLSTHVDLSDPLQKTQTLEQQVQMLQEQIRILQELLANQKSNE